MMLYKLPILFSLFNIFNLDFVWFCFENKTKFELGSELV